MGGTIRVRDRRAKGDDSLVLIDNFLAVFFLFMLIKCEDMYVLVVHLFMNSCVCVCAVLIQLFFEAHLRETSVVCHQ